MVAKKTRKRPSLKAAVENMCKQCIYDTSADGTWRQQVENCSSTECALYDVRPMTGKSIIASRQES
jgi:hypothetical protein